MVQARAQFVLDTQGCQVCQSLCLAPPGEWRLHNRDAGRGEARADLYFHRAKGSVSCDPGHPVTLTLVTRGQGVKCTTGHTLSHQRHHTSFNLIPSIVIFPCKDDETECSPHNNGYTRRHAIHLISPIQPQMKRLSYIFFS